MRTQEDSVQQRGTTGDQQKPPSKAAVSLSLRGSFLALRTHFRLNNGLEGQK